MRLSCEDLSEGASSALAATHSLRRTQLSRSRSGGIFANPFRSDRDKMDQLAERLNHYSIHGLPEQSSLLGHCRRERDEEDGDLALEDHWTVFVDIGEAEMDKKTQNQQDAVWELLQTEVFYIKRLRVVTDLFLACLCNLQSECLLNDVDTEKMFSNISQVYEANHNFWINCLLPMLNTARASHQPLNPLLMKDGFLKFDQLFYPYLKYCLEHSNCLQYVKEKNKESELFKAYVVWCETRKECERLRLYDLLVAPMQRLTKYSLLVKAILRKTEVDGDIILLKRMNEAVEHFVLGVDASLRHRHEEERLAWIASRIESYDAIESGSDEVEKVLRDYCRLDFLTRPMLGCRSHQIRQLVLEGSGLKLRDSSSSSKVDVHCFLFTDILLVCKSLGKKSSDKVRVIRQPYLVDRLVSLEHKDGSGFALIYVNEFRVASTLFTLYTSEARTWLDHLKKAQDMYLEAKQRASRSPSIVYRSTMIDDDDEFELPSRALLVAHGSPRSSRSSLIHSHSGSMDMSEMGSYAMLHIPPAPTPNLLGPQPTQHPSRAKSFELGELRNPSLAGYGDADQFGRSHSMEHRAAISISVTSPRPERRAFLLRGSKASANASSSPYSSTNTLNVPYQHAPQAHQPTDPPSINVDTSATLVKTTPPKVPPRRPSSPVNFQRCLANANAMAKPPLLKTKNISAGLTPHSAPASQGPSPAHSVESDPGSDGTPQSGASDGAVPRDHVNSHEAEECADGDDASKAACRLQQKRTSRTERRYHTADAIEHIKKDKDVSIHKRLSWNYGQQGRAATGPVPSYCERILCNKHLGKFLSSDSIYSSSGFSSTGSVPLSVGSSECEQCGLEVLGGIEEASSPTPSEASASPFAATTGKGDAETQTGDESRVQAGSTCTSSPLMMMGKSCDGLETCTSGSAPRPASTPANLLKGVRRAESVECPVSPPSPPSASIKIDVSEAVDGISSVQITRSLNACSRNWTVLRSALVNHAADLRSRLWKQSQHSSATSSTSGSPPPTIHVQTTST